MLRRSARLQVAVVALTLSHCADRGELPSSEAGVSQVRSSSCRVAGLQLDVRDCEWELFNFKSNRCES